MEFPTPHIHSPQGTHTHTAILLHGRGSNGTEFADELFSSLTTRHKNLPACLPTWRWVFPTAQARWTAKFKEEMRIWFDVSNNQNHQQPQRQQHVPDGLRESVWHVLGIFENEIHLLDGNSGSVYLGGISQGMATSLCTLFCASGRRGPRRLGGLLGFCGWLPFADQVEELIRSVKGSSPDVRIQRMRLVSGFFRETIDGGYDADDAEDTTSSASECTLATPVLLGHGTDDSWVSVELGRQALLLLQELMMGRVEWSEFSGAERDGHWIKEPESFDRILSFLEDGSNG